MGDLEKFGFPVHIKGSLLHSLSKESGLVLSHAPVPNLYLSQEDTGVFACGIDSMDADMERCSLTGTKVSILIYEEYICRRIVSLRLMRFANMT